MVGTSTARLTTKYSEPLSLLRRYLTVFVFTLSAGARPLSLWHGPSAVFETPRHQDGGDTFFLAGVPLVDALSGTIGQLSEQIAKNRTQNTKHSDNNEEQQRADTTRNKWDAAIWRKRQC